MTGSKTLHLLSRVIPFSPDMAAIVGGALEAIFLRQLIYWSDKGRSDDEWIYKSAHEWEEETSLTPKVQRRVRGNLVKLGVIEERNDRLNHKMYFRFVSSTFDKMYEDHFIEKEGIGFSRNSHRAVREVPDGQSGSLPSGSSRSDNRAVRKEASETGVNGCDTIDCESIEEEVFRHQSTTGEYLQKSTSKIKEGKRARGRATPPPLEVEVPNELKSSSAFTEAWKEWEAHRRTLRKPLTSSVAKRQMKQLSDAAVEWGVAGALRMLEYSLNGGYQGLFRDRAAPEHNLKRRVERSTAPSNGDKKEVLNGF